MMDHQGGQRAQSSKRRIVFVGVVLLMVCVVVAVAVPVALAKGGSNGEHEDDIEAMLEPKAGFDSKTQLSVTLGDLHSSSSSNSTDDLSNDGLEDEPLGMNGTDASNTTLTDATQNISRDITQDSSNTDTEESIMIQPLPPPGLAVIVDSFTVLATIPHDSQAFTQGLTFDPLDSSVVYESTGLYGRSSVRKVDITTGEVLLKTDTSREMFGEGLAYYTTKTTPAEGRLIHITWQSQRGFIFDAETLTVMEEFRFETERNQGWGITYNPIADQFLVTDGSSMLHFWDRDLNEVTRIQVTLQLDEGGPKFPVNDLNEIEWDNDTQTVLANVWRTDNILRIDPISGAVLVVYGMGMLNRPFSADVLNGIAISPTKELWVTGKLWPNMYKIEFNER